ncbi:MAG: hypothetical protein K2I23_06335 [Clostridia bacterium]|nr:hypothetical protein [Clostridia bacterium]
MARSEKMSFDKDISMDLKHGEELLWRATPKKSSFVFSKSVQLLPLALIVLSFDGFCLFLLFKSEIPSEIVLFVKFFVLVFYAFHLLPVWFWIASIIKAFKSHKDFEYAFTNERIIICEKNMMTNYYYREITGAGVSANLIDKLFKVGDLNFHIICLPIENFNNPSFKVITLQDIENPYAICEKVNQLIAAHEEERNALTKRPRKDDYNKFGHGKDYD